jgi:hypothetical protein
MKIILFFVFFVSTLVAYEQKFELGIDGIGYSKYSNGMLANGSAKISFSNELFQTDAKLEFLYSSKYKERRYLLLNELYITKEFDDYIVSLGKKIKYWGEMEGYNLADIYNQKNYLQDPFDKNAKYGAIGADITRYFDENSLELGVKFYEDDISYPQGLTPYSPFPISYDKRLELSNQRYTPTVYVSANIVSDTSIDSETKVILLHGYDTKRNIILNANFSLSQYAYRVNKALLLSHIIYADTIFKTELSYTDVIDYAPMSDYTQLSFGVEKSFYEIAKTDITLYTEYYRYIYKDNTKINNVDISEIYDNDLFLALRINFNDVRSSELKVGFLEDMTKNERILKAEVSSRVFDSFVLHGEYLYIVSHTADTLLSQFDNSSRFILGMKYTY